MEDVHWWFVGRRRILLQLLDRYLGPNGSHERRILDVGCGTGTMLTHLATFGKAEGVDIDDEVTALDVVEHLDDDAAAFREMRRVLRPGGLLLVTVPAHRFLWGDQDEVNLHKRRYSSAELRDRLVSTGFDVLRLSYMNSLLFAPIAAIRMLRWLERRVRPRIPHQSDFRYPAPRPVNFVLGHVFGAEGRILRRADMPFGVSIVALAQKDSRAVG